MRTDLPLPGRREGKVRDIYEARLEDGAEVLLIVATDRISAYDVVMPNPVPGKGVVLTQLARFWFERVAEAFGDRSPHHLLATDADRVQGLSPADRRSLDRRVMVGRKTRVIPIECVARGYLAGSGWTSYQRSQQVCGVKLPAGLRQCDRLPEPIFTPATKAQEGHDENISFDRACEIVGGETMERLRDWTLKLYRMAHDFAAERGLILADTKFEFGKASDGRILLIDEILTPDSSRYWPADDYAPGRDQQSFDKQYVRNFLSGLVEQGRWNKTSPAPKLPEPVVRNTLEKYRQAYRRLTGESLTL